MNVECGMIGPHQIMIICGVVILLFGARKIPQFMKGIGEGMKEWKNARKEIDPDE